MPNYKDKKYRGSSNKMKNDRDLGIDDLKLVSFSSLSADEVLCYNGTNWVNGTVSGGGGSISCFSYNSGSSALVATADLTSTCSALFGDVLISGNTITPDDSNTVTCLGADGTLNISGNLNVQGDFLKLPQATSSSTITGNAASAGALRYNTTTNTIQVHNGTEFTGVGGGGGGIALTDLSVGTEASASGDGGIAYNSGTGVFTYTPPTAAGIGALADITSENLSELANVDTTAPTDGQVLTWDNANSYWKPATASGGASSLNELSDVTYETTTENLGIGTNALASLQVGAPYNPTGNIVIGFNAGTNISIASQNIVLGYNAVCNGCNVGHTVAIGCDALKELQQGECNLAIGPGALRCQTEQLGKNVAVGAFAGASITTGCQNTILGIQAGWKMTTQSGSTIVGYLANGQGSATGGDNNVIIGEFAGYCNTGYCNVYLGKSAAMSATNSYNNVVIGTCAAHNLKNGCMNNVVIGTAAGCRTYFKCSVLIGQHAGSGGTFNCTGPDKSVFIGYRAGFKALCEEQVIIGHNAGYNTTGNRNVFMGASAGKCNTSGGSNVYIGFEAGQASCTGYANIGIGSEALKLVKGNCNIAIGTSAGFNTASQTGCNTIVIGNYAQASSASASNEITLGNNSISTIRANTTSISSLSDQRDKTNICDLSVGLCFVDELKPVTFDWNRRDGTMSGQKDVGFIAQDLDSLQQKYNIEDHLNIVLKSNPDRLEASPGKLIPILVKAIQELTKKVEELENKIGK